MASEVNEWYRGRKVLVTGASGLMGKVLIEKLLYSVPDIGCVYALVRSKRGKTPESRIEDMWKLPLFSRIREEKPHVMKKLVPVTGDILYDNLGIENDQLEKINDENFEAQHQLEREGHAYIGSWQSKCTSELADRIPVAWLEVVCSRISRKLEYIDADSQQFPTLVDSFIPELCYVLSIITSFANNYRSSLIEGARDITLFSTETFILKCYIFAFQDGPVIRHLTLTLLIKVSVLFHFAASLRLEAPLKEGLEMNTKGTLRVLDVAKKIKNLLAFVHLSTAFCYPDYERMAEKVHDPPANPHDVLRAASWLSEDQLNLLAPSMMQKHPNSYTYSKRLAEALVKESYPQIPAVVVRPSIVTPSYKEPTPGWVDNLNGPIGLMIGAGKGVIRTMHCYGHYHAEVIPVDIAINSIILIPYYINTKIERPAEIPVFNLTSGDDRDTTWKEVLDVGKATVRKFPFEGPLWYPNGNIRHSKLIHELCVFFYHIIPAYLIDFLMLIFGQKRFMVRIQNRISVGLEVLQYFTTREWWFDTHNFKALATKLNHTDFATFPMNLAIIEVGPYVESCMIGGKLYCLKEKLENLPKARLQNNILFLLDLIVSAFFYLFLLYWLVHFFEPLRVILSYGGPFVRYLPLVGNAVFRDA